MSRPILAAAMAASCALLFTPVPVLACGGFFCGGTPIDQTGEDIVFAVDGRTIEAHVSIRYSGDAESFSWVVPVPGVPELSVGTEQLFAALSARTYPTWRVAVGDSSCDDPQALGSWSDDDDSASDDDDAAIDDDDAAPPVVVLAEEVVGAYEATVVAATSAGALLDWFNCNGYRVAYSALPRIDAYLADNMNFLALKLRGGFGVGELSPIVMEYTAPRPVIPLVLTAVATQPNLRVRTWILGESRAVPTNYDHVWVNDSRVNWAQGGWWANLGNGVDYESLIGAAIDEAGGRAFVTDQSGPFEGLRGTVYPPWGYDTEPLRAITDPVEFVRQALWMGLPRNATMQSLLRRHIPMPQELVDLGLSESSFYNDLGEYAELLGPFDPNAFVDDINAILLEPMEAAEALFDDPDLPYITRMQTILSGWEMDVDPAFTFVPVPAETASDQVTEYPHTGFVARDQWLLQDFHGGGPGVACWLVGSSFRNQSGVRRVFGFPQDVSTAPDFPTMDELPLCTDLPAAMIVERFDVAGAGQVVADHRAAIAAAAPGGYCMPGVEAPLSTDPPADVEWPPDGALMPLEEVDPAECASLDGDPPPDEVPDEEPDGDAVASTCAGCGSSLGGGGGVLLLLGVGALRRRRR